MVSLNQRTRARRAICSADLSPCTSALLFPGAPVERPPCILHRFMPLIAGDWHSVPLRVLAKHRGDKCMGWIGNCGTLAPYVDGFCDHRLAAFIDVNMPDNLLAAAPMIRKRLHLSGERAAQLGREVAVLPHVIEMRGELCPARHLHR